MFDWKMIIRRLLKIGGGIYSRIRLSFRLNWVFYLIVLAYIITMSSITILKHNVFLTSGFDLGIYNQALSTTLFENKFFYESGDLSFNPGGSFFGVHFSPILFVLLPFYAIYPFVENLLVMQTVILALGAFPIYWMCREKVSKKLANIVALIYLLYPAVVLLNLNDFHIQAFTSTFFLFSLYYLEREKWRHFLGFLILAFCTIEFAPIVGAFVALYGFILYRKKGLMNGRNRAYIAVAALLAILFFFVSLQIKVVFNDTVSPISSTFGIVFQDPSGALAQIFNDPGGKIFYIISFLAPLAFIPLLAPEPLVMALPWIGLSFISPYVPYHSVFYQYTAFVIPFVMIALIKGIKRLDLRQGKKIAPVLILATIISLIYLPLTPGAPWNYQLPVPDENDQMRHEILALIPSNASVLTMNDMFPHVSGRSNSYMYNATDNYPIWTDYVIADFTSQWYMWEPEITGSKQNPREYVKTAMATGDYGVYASAQGLVLLKKGYSGNPVLYEPYVSELNYKSLSLQHGSIVRDNSSVSEYVLFHGNDQPNEYFFYGPHISFPFGLFKVTFILKADGIETMEVDRPLFSVDVSTDSGKYTLENRTMYVSDVPYLGQWFPVSFYIWLKTPADMTEFRCDIHTKHNLYFDYVKIEQISPRPISEKYFDYRIFQKHAVTLHPFTSWVKRGTVVDGVITHIPSKTFEGEGTFWYGPYYNYSYWPEGNYTARFWLKLDRLYNGKILDLVVATKAGTELLGELGLYSYDFEAINKWQSFEVNFELPEWENNDKIEFAGLRVKDGAPVSFLLVDVYEQIDPFYQIFTKLTFDSGDLSIDNGMVSNNVLTHLKPSGSFWHGPYIPLARGNYTAKFWLKLDKDYNGTLLDIDVAIDSGRTVLSSATVSASDFEKVDKWQSFDVKFTLQTNTWNVEFRGINVRESAPVSLRWIEIEIDPDPSQQPIFKAIFDHEDLKLDIGRVTDNVMTHVRGSGTFWHGPYVDYSSWPVGKYTAKFWLKLDSSYEGPIMDLVVATNNGTQLLAEQGINNFDFEAIDTWQSFEVDFDLPKWTENDRIEFSGMRIRDLAPVSFLLVEVYSRTGG